LDIIEITEIGERSITGVSSRPFKCQGDDNLDYYVKLGNAIPDEKINEWVFGFLANQMELPTPPGKIVSVNQALSKSSLIDTTEFGHGLGYGSLEFPDSNELESQKIKIIDQTLQSEILLFDWWILNEDRKLGKLGGNPNLLIDHHNQISLIDHGNAMDEDFCINNFFSDHAMTDTKTLWRDSSKRKHWLHKAQQQLHEVKMRWKSLPEEWLSNGSTLTLQKVLNRLEYPFTTNSNFWEPFT